MHFAHTYMHSCPRSPCVRLRTCEGLEALFLGGIHAVCGKEVAIGRLFTPLLDVVWRDFGDDAYIAV